MSDGDFQFRPPDRRRLWQDLALTMSQASSLTGVSERQIQHWMDQGYITPSVAGTRKINGESLDQIVLIRQARAAGIPLRRAVAMAREYLNSEGSALLGNEVASGTLRELNKRLEQARDGIDMVQTMLADIAQSNGNLRGH